MRVLNAKDADLCRGAGRILEDGWVRYQTRLRYLECAAIDRAASTQWRELRTLHRCEIGVQAAIGMDRLRSRPCAIRGIGPSVCGIVQ